jgi:glucuronate isomerase
LIAATSSGIPLVIHESLCLGYNRNTGYHIVETAGLYNLAGFNDDTRAFASIPSRHDVWRRVSSDWLAGMVVQGMLDEDEAAELAHELAFGLAQRAYRVPKERIR